MGEAVAILTPFVLLIAAGLWSERQTKRRIAAQKKHRRAALRASLIRQAQEISAIWSPAPAVAVASTSTKALEYRPR